MTHLRRRRVGESIELQLRGYANNLCSASQNTTLLHQQEAYVALTGPSDRPTLLEETVKRETNESDEQLLARMGRGDEDALLAILKRYQDRIYQFGLLMTGNRGFTEEMTLGVLLHMTRNLRRFNDAKMPLESLLLRKSCESVRRFGKTRDEEISHSDGEDLIADRTNGTDEIEQARDLCTVQRAVLRLPVFYREALVLCEIQGITHSQVAELLSCRIEDLRSRLRHARSLLLGELAALRLKSLQQETSRTHLDRGVQANA